MKKIIMTFATSILTLAAAHGGWETAGIIAPQQFFKIKLNCHAINNSGPIGRRNPLIAYDETSNLWYLGTGALTPTSPINYNLLKIDKIVSAKKTTTIYFSSFDKLMKVKIIKDNQDHIKSAAIKEANSINYICQPAPATKASEQDSQILFKSLHETENIQPIPFIEYSMISVQKVVCDKICSGIDTNSGNNFVMSAETSKLFKEHLSKVLLATTKQSYTLPLTLAHLSAKTIDCSAGYNMMEHRDFSQCDIVW